MKAIKLPDTEFKTTVIKISKEHIENFNKIRKYIEMIKKETVINEEYN